MRRAIGLVRPGGWLILEDADQASTWDGDGELDPATGAFVDAYVRIIQERGANPGIGKCFASILNASRAFSEINVRKVAIPISEHSGGKSRLLLACFQSSNVS